MTDSEETTFNVSGCIALLDKTDGTACAQALAPLLECDDAACSTCFTASPDETLVDECYTTAESGACSSYVGSANSLCASDFADGGVANTSCQDPTTVVNLFCGTGG
jgi:hypothetical protein